MRSPERKNKRHLGREREKSKFWAVRGRTVQHPRPETQQHTERNPTTHRNQGRTTPHRNIGPVRIGRAKPRTQETLIRVRPIPFRPVGRSRIIGSCHRLLGVDHKEFEILGDSEPQTSEYNNRCQYCWESQGSSQNAVTASSPTSLSSSSSSTLSDTLVQSLFFIDKTTGFPHS